MERSKSLNYISYTHPLQQGDELFVYSINDPNLPNKNDKIQQPHKVEGSSSDINKKITHRNVERQRRHEMTMQYELLRSLLPVEYIKGKRSISDHMYEATKYIKHLEEKIKDLDEKRDRLKKWLNSITPGVVNEGSFSSDKVVVRPCWAGVEAIVSTSLQDRILPFSRLLRVFVDEGVDVVNCVTTQSNQMLIHTMQSEASNLGTVDISRLEQKLMYVVESASRAS